MYETLLKTMTESWLVLGQMSPYLLLGFLVAGILSIALSPAWIERHLSGRGLGPSLKAALFGVPMPLCSCGVIPVSASLRQHGASRAATTSFLLSTPQTGVDSIAVTYALLGPVFAVFRPIAALVTGVVGGALVHLLGDSAAATADAEAPKPECTDDCCADSARAGVAKRALRYGFVTLPRDLAMALLVGVLIAGAMSALVPPDQLKPYVGGGVLSILLLMAAGVPIYVCATASVPIAAGFMHMGASPGAALAFLIAGPATNAATFTTIWKILGPRTALIFLFTVAASAVACALALDWLVPVVAAGLPELGQHVHEAEGGWFHHAAAIVLLGVLAFSYASTFRGKRGAGAAATEERPFDTARNAERLELLVTGMTCDHCVQSVQRALVGRPGVQSATADARSGHVVVSGEQLDGAGLVAAVTRLGFDARVQDGANAPTRGSQ